MNDSLPIFLLLIAVAAVAGGIAWRRSSRQAARRLYRTTLESALADGMLTHEEIEELDRVRREKDLTAAEVRMVAKTIYRGALRAALIDEQLTPEEDQTLARLQLQLGLTERDLGEDSERLARLRLLAQVSRAELPRVDSPVALAPQEVCHWVVQATRAERLELPRRSRAAIAGVRLDVAGTAPFSAAGTREALRPNEEILPADIGMLVVTSRRAVFQGARRSESVAFARLDHVMLYSDGLRIVETGGHESGYLLVDDAEVTAAVLLQAARRRREEIRPTQRGRSA
jgi:hypothetical protein